MPTERLAPTSFASTANLNGAVTDIDEDPDTPDADWMTTTSGGAAGFLANMADPSSAPSTGAGLQEFKLWLRKNATGGNTVSFECTIREANTQRAVVIGSTNLADSTAGELFSGTWNASVLGTADGTAVQMRFDQTGGHTGSGGVRRYIEIGAIEWNATVAGGGAFTPAQNAYQFAEDGTESGATLIGTLNTPLSRNL